MQMCTFVLESPSVNTVVNLVECGKNFTCHCAVIVKKKVKTQHMFIYFLDK